MACRLGFACVRLGRPEFMDVNEVMGALALEGASVGEHVVKVEAFSEDVDEELAVLVESCTSCEAVVGEHTVNVEAQP